MTEEIALLKDYVASGSQSAFAGLARRYVDLVYSSAKRQVYNDAHAAEDVTQAVFLLLAQKARSIPADRPLSAWLLKVTGYCASNARRKRDRQESHERRAADMVPTNHAPDLDPDWEKLAPLLDDGLNKLPAADRDAILLRFMEKKSLRQIGDSLGISEEAAQKRVTRAVDKLREFFHRRGVVTLSAAGLAALLTSQSVHAAPVSLTTAVASSAASAAAATSAGASLAKGALIIMAAEKIKVAVIVTVLLILAIGGSIAFVKAYTSPSRRTVLVATDTPAPTRAAVAPPRLPSKWPLKFSDGTLMEVLALNDPNADPSLWWLPDGTPTPDPQFRANGSITMNYATGRRIDLIVRMTGAALASKGINVRSDVSGDDDTATLSSGSATNRMVKVIVPVGMEPTGSLYFGLAGGAWDEKLNLNFVDSVVSLAGATAAGVEFRSITEKNGQTVVHVHPRAGSGKRDNQFVVITGGKELAAISTWSNLLEDTYTFRTPRSKVTGIIARSRPYEWIEMRNVALNPMTTPNAVAVAPTTMPTTGP